MTSPFTAMFERAVVLLCGLVCAAVSMGAGASEFALAASPPRFEIQLKAGENSRQVIELTNASLEATALAIKTADWSLAPDNAVTFYDELQAGSCRPWIAIERRTLTLSGGRPYRFRFEISVPADTPPSECRMAIMLEGQEQVSRSADGPVVPFSARLGVIVYVAVGDTAPKLSVVGSRVQLINGIRTPVLDIRNSGTAHGRLGGFLSGTDASKTDLEFSPSSLPILAGETRTIPLAATRPGDPETAVQVQFPITVSGKLEWGKGQTQTVEQRFAP